MRVRLKLFFHWGIQFGEPYAVPEQGSRRVAYASKSELVECHLRQIPTSSYANAAGEGGL